MTRAKAWNVSQFERSDNLPEIVGDLQFPEIFAFTRGLRVLDMPIKLPGQSWALPSQLGQFAEAIRLATDFEGQLAPISHAYITVDQKPIGPGLSQRRPGWHSDAYLEAPDGTQLDVVAENATAVAAQTGMVERTYIVYDVLPTLFLPGPFPIQPVASDCDEVLRTFNDVAAAQAPITYPPFSVLCLDPYCVHSVQLNETAHVVERTFLKIQFSNQRYNRAGNTRNSLLDYEWPMVPRDPDKREHRYLAIPS